jgi:hypothetical protein
MTKYGIAKRGFGKALRQSFKLGGVSRFITKEAAREKGAKKISDIVSKKRKEYLDSRKEIDARKLETLSPKKIEEVKSFEKQRKELPAYKDMTRSERETMVESTEKIYKKLYPGGMKEQMEHYAEKGVKGDPHAMSARKYKGKKIEGKNYFERAKKAQKLREED